jgi:hypothetical protein
MTPTKKAAVRGIEQVMVSSEFSGVRCQAIIRNATKGAIKLWLDTKIIAGTAAEVTFAPGFKQSGTVLYCRRDGQGFSAVISFKPADPARREERVDVSESCVVLELGTQAAPAMPSRVANISRSGMGLMARSPLKVGALVSVALADDIFIGEVRHCTQVERGQFRIGLSIEHQTPRTFDPAEREAEPPVPPREWSARLSHWAERLLGVTHRAKA